MRLFLGIFFSLVLVSCSEKKMQVQDQQDSIIGSPTVVLTSNKFKGRLTSLRAQYKELDTILGLRYRDTILNCAIDSLYHKNEWIEVLLISSQSSWDVEVILLNKKNIFFKEFIDGRYGSEFIQVNADDIVLVRSENGSTSGHGVVNYSLYTVGQNDEVKKNVYWFPFNVNPALKYELKPEVFSDSNSVGVHVALRLFTCDVPVELLSQPEINLRDCPDKEFELLNASRKYILYSKGKSFPENCFSSDEILGSKEYTILLNEYKEAISRACANNPEIKQRVEILKKQME